MCCVCVLIAHRVCIYSIYLLTDCNATGTEVVSNLTSAEKGRDVLKFYQF